MEYTSRLKIHRGFKHKKFWKESMHIELTPAEAEYLRDNWPWEEFDINIGISHYFESEIIVGLYMDKEEEHEFPMLSLLSGEDLHNVKETLTEILSRYGS